MRAGQPRRGEAVAEIDARRRGHLGPVEHQQGELPGRLPHHLGFGIGRTDGGWMYGRGGANPGSGANRNVYPDAGWVGVVVSNYDNVPLREIAGQEGQAITGQS